MNIKANPQLLNLITKSLEEFKAKEIVKVELAGKSAIADYMVIASGTSSRQVTAMAENIVTTLKKNGVKSINVEGINFGDWVLVDGGDIIVHLFRPEVREFYGLEKMWGVEFETKLVSSDSFSEASQNN
jgi:ribosome-associated protein